MSTYSEFETLAIQLARAAGDLVVPGFGKARAAVDKGRAGFATQFDIDAEHLIVSGIHAKYPDHSILAEEGSSEQRTAEFTWVIDPIDGTHNYMHGVPMFAVAIAVKHHDEHIVGVTYLPLTKEMFHGVKGNGAFKDGQQVHCSDTKNLSDAFLSVETTRRMQPEEQQRHLALSRSIFRSRSIGSAACSLAYTAEGVFDGYADLHQQTHEWDWAAGKLLVEEAGGTFKIFPGKGVAATSKQLAASLEAIVQGSSPAV